MAMYESDVSAAPAEEGAGDEEMQREKGESRGERRRGEGVLSAWVLAEGRAAGRGRPSLPEAGQMPAAWRRPNNEK